MIDRAAILRMMRSVVENDPPAPSSFKLIYSTSALKETDERLFPFSKHRSRRVRKKLMKRHGSEFRMEPAVYQVQDMIIAHPSLKAAIDRQFRDRLKDSPQSHWGGFNVW